MSVRSRSIRIENIYVEETNKVCYTVEYGSEVRKFFTDESFFAEYEIDISEVPIGLLGIPLLANLMPLAWATNAEVYIKELDSLYYSSLQSLKQVYQTMYPDMRFAGKLHVERLVDSERPTTKEPRSAMFYSAGVDSLATFIRKKQEKPYFVTIWGADVLLNQPEFWFELKNNVKQFGERNEIESLFIKSNLHTFINEGMISYYFGRHMSSWWHGVQHSTGLIGLVAPLAYVNNISQFYIPSAVPTEQSKIRTHGCSHLFDNKIKWSGTHVNLEALELWRQDKVKLIADYIRTEDSSLQIRVCWRSPVYGNCSKCEKCARTAIGLLLEGIDPNEHGFKLTTEILEGHKSVIIPAWSSHLDYAYVEWDKLKSRSFQQLGHVPLRYVPFFHWMQQVQIKRLKKHKSKLEAWVKKLPPSWFMFVKKQFKGYKV
ncbi:hypothetical protein EHS13_05615 [Paenibacillus psychroresistens]|uniref:Uncharacterized protein n=1 Tax=Paenibacillus psychroresistens TaxID=1778678 RepID=A0A6B8RG66_9BACL|nr:hypothetical protein [Paenibacillus psychroresistens]QGQ94418.1 hypothetical protein EHS13_05615 [Paenibacillus psychroresistens]